MTQDDLHRMQSWCFVSIGPMRLSGSNEVNYLFMQTVLQIPALQPIDLDCRAKSGFKGL